MLDFYNNNAGLIVFLHVVSAVMWIGGMFIIKFVVHPSIQSISDSREKLSLSLSIMKKLFSFMIPFIFILLLTASLLIIGIAPKDGSKIHLLFFIKETILIVMILNFGYMIYIRINAQRVFNNINFTEAKSLLSKVSHLLLPINMLLGVVLIYVGVLLRGL